ncbi:MAG TPA: flagellar protein FlaG [Thermoanaerobacterales bacterium]|nr:flagellar protein FlaG [Thermoanaerobacterales bacterium]
MKVEPVDRAQYIHTIKPVDEETNNDTTILKKEPEIKLDKHENETPQEKLQDSIEALNKTVEVIDKKYEFFIHKESERAVVRVLERATGEVINQIPPEEVLNIIAKIRDIIGVFVDERV